MTRIELLAHLLAGSAAATTDNGKLAACYCETSARTVVDQANRIADLVFASVQERFNAPTPSAAPDVDGPVRVVQEVAADPAIVHALQRQGGSALKLYSPTALRAFLRENGIKIDCEVAAPVGATSHFLTLCGASVTLYDSGKALVQGKSPNLATIRELLRVDGWAVKG